MSSRPRLWLIIIFAISVVGSADAKVSLSGMNPEALGAKAFLEELIVRRYSQELSTQVDHQNFVLGAQLDLAEVVPAVKKPLAMEPEPEPINDLMLGTLDPEALLKKETSGDEKVTAQGFL